MQLIEKVAEEDAIDMDSLPILQGIEVIHPWREYAPFLKGAGLVSNHAGKLCLTDAGMLFRGNQSKRCLANLMNSRFRLFGEVLDILNTEPDTVQGTDARLCKLYHLNWVHCSNTRRRMDWLEVLNLIQGIGNRKWQITEEGVDAIKSWTLITPELIGLFDEVTDDAPIASPPPEIEMLLRQLSDSPELHKKRSTYNIWVPSPNRIDNLRVITQFALDRVTKKELFRFVGEEFNIKASSVESMLPFLKAAGLIEEVGRAIYIATPAAKAWCETGNDLDFIRILHVNMRFVGELINAATDDIARNDLYAQAKKYGLNTEKARWIVGFLLEAGVLEEPHYLHLKATPLGSRFLSGLPIADPSVFEVTTLPSLADENAVPKSIVEEKMINIFERVHKAAHDPMAEGKASGVAFEEAIADIFCFMGFDAKRIGGSGDTDVLVRWKDSAGKNVIAIVDAKSKSSGTVTHTDVSDVAIETHKDKNHADYVAIVGPDFGGDTIRNHARKKGFALISVTELIEIAKSVHSLGLDLQEIAILFHVPDGLSKLTELIAAKQREIDLVTLVVSTFSKQQELHENLSARDLYWILQNTEISPSSEELLSVFETLSRPEIDILHTEKAASPNENTMFALAGGRKTVNRLRALATAIEAGLA